MSNKKENQSYSGEIKNDSNKEIKTVKEKMVTIIFKENRKFDLHIGRKMETFFGRESKSIPASWLEHEDWQNVKHYFNIKGV